MSRTDKIQVSKNKLEYYKSQEERWPRSGEANMDKDSWK